MSLRYHRDISVAAPPLPQYFLVRILGSRPRLCICRRSAARDRMTTFRHDLTVEPCILDLESCIWVGGRKSALRLREDQFHRSINFLFGGEPTDREPDRGAGQLRLNTHRLQYIRNHCCTGVARRTGRCGQVLGQFADQSIRILTGEGHTQGIWKAVFGVSVFHDVLTPYP